MVPIKHRSDWLFTIRSISEKMYESTSCFLLLSTESKKLFNIKNFCVDQRFYIIKTHAFKPITNYLVTFSPLTCVIVSLILVVN